MKRRRWLLTPAFLLAGALAVSAETDADEKPALVVPPLSDRPVVEEAESAPTEEALDQPPGRELLEKVSRSAAGEEAPPAAEETPDDSIVHPGFPLSRYEKLWERPPFHLESVAPPEESAALAQRYALTGIAEIDGKPIAFLMERASQQRMIVEQEARDSGLALVSVDLSAQKYEDSTVTIQQGAEVGVIKFDAGPAMPPQAMGLGAQPPQVPMGIPPQPGVPGGAPGAVPGQVPPPGVPGQAPQVAATQPGVPPVPGQPPAPGQVVQQPGEQPMPPPRVIRRRAIVPSAP